MVVKISSPSKMMIYLYRTSLAMFGKFFASSSFALVYMYTAELLPTTIRLGLPLVYLKTICATDLCYVGS